MATIINKRNKIGSRFKETVARLISFTPTTTITGTNVQAALEEVDAHVLASTAISDDEFEATTEIPRDADTLCGVDGESIISDITQIKADLEGLITIKTYNITGTSNSSSIAGYWYQKSLADDVALYGTPISATMCSSNSHAGIASIVGTWMYGTAKQSSTILRVVYFKNID